jgi:hypothetical protein
MPQIAQRGLLLFGLCIQTGLGIGCRRVGRVRVPLAIAVDTR